MKTETTKMQIEYLQLLQEARLEGESLLALHLRVFRYYVADQRRIMLGKVLRSTNAEMEKRNRPQPESRTA